MTKDAVSGYREREHTADWALDVWSPDLPGLFTTAAEGMQALMGVSLAGDIIEEQAFRLQSADPEGLLVRFLSELLYYGDDLGLGFLDLRVQIQPEVKGGLRLDASGTAAKLLGKDKEIKAVTYHNLRISQVDGQWRTTIVFDV